MFWQIELWKLLIAVFSSFLEERNMNFKKLIFLKQEQRGQDELEGLSALNDVIMRAEQRSDHARSIKLAKKHVHRHVAEKQPLPTAHDLMD